MKTDLLHLCVYLISMFCLRLCATLEGSMPSHRQAQIRLKEKVMSHRATRARLSPTDDGHVNVSLIFYPVQILRIDEVEQSMRSINYVELTWLDKDLAWNRSQYDDISVIALDYEDLWHPTLVVKNSVSKYDLTTPDSVDRLLLSESGHVTFYFVIFLETLCSLDFTYFPFDQQTCETDIVSVRDDTKVQLNTLNAKYQSEPAVFKGEWSIMNRDLESGSLYNLGEILYFARAKVMFKRNSLFYVVFMIVPMAASSLMTSVVFLVPPSCEQKVSFLVTIFVSNAVFLDFLAATIPRSVTVMPRVMLFQIFSQLQCFLALVASLVVIRRHKQEVLSVNHKKNGGGHESREELPVEILSTECRKIPVDSLAAKRMKMTVKPEGDLLEIDKKNFPERNENGQEFGKNIRPWKGLRHFSAKRLDCIFFWLFNVASLPFYIELFLQLN